VTGLHRVTSHWHPIHRQVPIRPLHSVPNLDGRRIVDQDVLPFGLASHNGNELDISLMSYSPFVCGSIRIWGRKDNAPVVRRHPCASRPSCTLRRRSAGLFRRQHLISTLHLIYREAQWLTRRSQPIPKREHALGSFEQIGHDLEKRLQLFIVLGKRIDEDEIVSRPTRALAYQLGQLVTLAPVLPTSGEDLDAGFVVERRRLDVGEDGGMGFDDSMMGWMELVL
jgi:hypothetical protein